MNIDEKIIYEDEDFIAVNKPTGMLVIPDRFDKTKENLFDDLNKKYGKVFIVHRLDKDTSGIVIFAKNAEAHRDLSMKWEAGQVSKTYYAIVTGRLSEKIGTINMGISPLKKKKGVMTIDIKNGKRSVTNYKVMEEYKDFSFLEVKPNTGRTHQIRVHLAAIGHPLAVDPLYNRKEAIGRGIKRSMETAPLIPKSEYKKGRNFIAEKIVPPIARLPLHAGKISFFHFRKNKEIEIETKLPDDIKTAIDILGLQKFYSGKDKKKN
jgi:23S rRNA pseudouridine955/2504/2580 synthase/23S rRNA pseudouridine1911/1915/1917 synthase